ncbi:hypothetical protein [Paenirhodobacter populi]|uniref:Uncharacterized protein n=1 Tax=Paenirhodobacter populi TaxID=2306993 RepID=A0A443IMH6_9RHOB|nr:hypothetical protein [Sinirhodobacter populi]RWR06817.1 hypothetical protein D2T33_18140 [Sinirhodobacter populi]
MPFPVFFIAIPVLHSSGAWIASTAASGYIAGTLSGTWIGAFILGNSALLGNLGLVSVAGIFGASGALSGLSSSAALSLGAGLSAVGLGGVANALGIAPAATFLGLTPIGWAIGGTSAIIVTALGYYFTGKMMRRLNDERQKGGLEPTTVAGIIREVRQFEAQSMLDLLRRLEVERDDVLVSANDQEVTIAGRVFSIGRLKYLINEDGSEEIVFVTKIGRKRRVLLVKVAPAPAT